MSPRLPVDRTTVSLVAYVVLAALVGGFLHNPFDPIRYAEAAIGILDGENIYARKGTVYPPTLYVVGAGILVVLSGVAEVSADGYLAIATFVGIGATVQAIAYVMGDAVIDGSYSTEWVLAGLLSPFVLYVVVLFGQMEPFVTLAIAGAIYAERTGRWEVGGASVALGASVKLFPVVLLLPLLTRNRAHARRILRGAVPVGVATTLLTLWYFPGSLQLLSSPLYGIRPVNPLYLLSLGLIPSWVTAGIFLVTFVAFTSLSACIPEGAVGYLLPLVPVVLTYPDALEYRWLPLAVGALYVGFLRRESQSGPPVDHRGYGWLWTVLGTLAMLFATIEGWYEGTPWLVPTFGTLQDPGAVFRPGHPAGQLGSLFRVLRFGVSVAFTLSVLHWCRAVYGSYTVRVPTSNWR